MLLLLVLGTRIVMNDLDHVMYAISTMLQVLLTFYGFWNETWIVSSSPFCGVLDGLPSLIWSLGYLVLRQIRLGLSYVGWFRHNLFL